VVFTVPYLIHVNGFYEFVGAVINGNTVTLTLTDNGLRDGGDSNGVANDGVIVDPGGGGGGGGCFIDTLAGSLGW